MCRTSNTEILKYILNTNWKVVFVKNRSNALAGVFFGKRLFSICFSLATLLPLVCTAEKSPLLCSVVRYYHRLARTIVLSRRFSIMWWKRGEKKGKRKRPKSRSFVLTCDYHINRVFPPSRSFALENVGIFVPCIVNTDAKLPIAIQVIHYPT